MVFIFHKSKGRGFKGSTVAHLTASALACQDNLPMPLHSKQVPPGNCSNDPPPLSLQQLERNLMSPGIELPTRGPVHPFATKQDCDCPTAIDKE